MGARYNAQDFMGSVQRGHLVTDPIPLVDHGPRFIVAVILDVDENGMHKISVNIGFLKTRFSHNQFGLYPQNLLNERLVNYTEKALFVTLKC